MPGRAATSTRTDPKSDSKGKTKAISASIPADAEAPAEEQAAKSQAPTAVQPVEPEDAYLTGVSRSLQRRLLGLNVEGARGGQAKPIPEATAAGQHSTGSYTKPISVPAKTPKSAKKK